MLLHKLVISAVLVGFLAYYGMAGAGIHTDGLILFLDANDPASYPGTGTDWLDMSGAGNHFIVNAGLFNGDGYFSPHDIIKDPAGGSNNVDFGQGTDYIDGTLIAWARPLSSNSDWRTLFRGHGTDSGASSFDVDAFGDHQFIIENSGTRFGMYNNALGPPGGTNGGFYPLTNSYGVNDVANAFTHFHMFTAVYSSTGPAMQVYINGTFVGETANTDSARFQGGLKWISRVVGVQPFGDVASVMFYNRKLEPTEISDLFDETSDF